MRFRTLDELTPSMELDRGLIHLSAFGGFFSRRTIDIWRRRTKMVPEYAAVFAVEGGRVLGQVFVLRIPYTFPAGVETITGIAAVATRPDRGRSGVARGIFREVHRLEQEAGIRHASLWTNRSWGAHHLYEKLGYRDVYSSPWAVHAALPRRKGRSRPAQVRPAKNGDLDAIERLHEDQAEGRLGFCPRPRGELRTTVAARELDPATDLIVARSGRTLLGYAHVERNPFRTVCGELVASSAGARRALIAAVGRASPPRPFAFQNTLITDSPDIFRPPEYAVVLSGWYCLMGNSYGKTPSEAMARREFGTDDHRFLCLAGDRF